MSADTELIRILVVDDHPLVREGIAQQIELESDMTLVAEAPNGREAIQQFRTHRPNITLMDLQMPEMGGLDALIAIRNEFPEARILVLTTYKGDVQIMRALKAGARGYLLKNSLNEELMGAIRAVHAGKRALSAEASVEIAQHATDEPLTPAELRVLRLIAEGHSNKEIAAQLSVSEETVKGQVRNILTKLGANDRTHAAMIGVARGMVEL
jgi:DNA-binding NarL/FixJ family response regulator